LEHVGMRRDVREWMRDVSMLVEIPNCRFLVSSTWFYTLSEPPKNRNTVHSRARTSPTASSDMGYFADVSAQ
jgi:hypothetical protein